MGYVTGKKASEILGLHPNTLRHYADNGTIKSFRLQSGHRRYDVESYLGLQRQFATVCDCRVSSSKQRDDLGRQVEFMRANYPGAEIIKDVVRYLNYKRKGLRALLGRAMRGDKLEVVVAHKDRLTRFGFELIEWIIQQSGGRIVVLKQTDLSPEPELTNDLLNILHVFSCRMHGLRNYKSQVRQALSEAGTKMDV